MLIAKLGTAIVGLGLSFIAQTTIPLDGPILAWLDLGTTIGALALLGYILRLVLSGGLVSKSLIETIVSQAVREALEE